MIGDEVDYLYVYVSMSALVLKGAILHFLNVKEKYARCWIVTSSLGGRIFF